MSSIHGRVLASLSLAIAFMMLAACAPAAAPAPTAAPTKAAAPAATTAPAAPAATKAPAAPAATAPAAAKSSFPEKNKNISLVVGYPAGGGSDIAARVVAPVMEKDMGVPVQVVNRAGAGSQVAVQSIASAKPDGYNVGYANWPNIVTIYLDPERKAQFGKKDFQAVAMHVTDPMAVAVTADNPIKNIKDLVAAAKAKPGQIKVGTSGILSNEHLGFLQLQKTQDIKFTIVHFDGASPAMTALLGDHIDAVGLGFSSVLSSHKSGQSRIIASFGKEGKQFLPEVQSMEDQGYTGFFGLSRGWFVPAGTPKEVVDTLNASFKKAMLSDEHQKKMIEIGQVTQYMDPAQYDKFWTEMEETVKPLMALANEK